MKYLQVTEREGRYISELRGAAVPQPRADEVLVRVAASGLNRADLSQIAGRYPPPPGEPEILGLEVAGTLPSSGERVCALLAGGGHAEYVAAPRGQVFPAPPALDLVPAAGIPEAFLTALVNLVVEGGLSAGDAGDLACALRIRTRPRFIGSMLGARSGTENAALAGQFRRDILRAFDGGVLRVTVDAVFRPARAVAAVQWKRDNANTGKIVID